MKYYEFNETDHYALIVVKESNNTRLKAMEVYVSQVAYDCVEDLVEEGCFPDEITKDQALLQFLEAVANTNPETTVRAAIEEFKESVDCALVIDSSLT